METTYSGNIKCPYCGHENAYKRVIPTMNDDDLSVPCQSCGKMIEPQKKTDIPEVVLERCARAALKPVKDAIFSEDELWGLLPPNARNGIYATTARVLTAAHYAEMVEAHQALCDSVEELLEVARLRGDNELPHPENDPKLWTARMQTAWDDLQAAIDDARTALKQAGVMV